MRFNVTVPDQVGDAINQMAKSKDISDVEAIRRSLELAFPSNNLKLEPGQFIPVYQRLDARYWVYDVDKSESLVMITQSKGCIGPGLLNAEATEERMCSKHIVHELLKLKKEKESVFSRGACVSVEEIVAVSCKEDLYNTHDLTIWAYKPSVANRVLVLVAATEPINMNQGGCYAIRSLPETFVKGWWMTSNDASMFFRPRD